MKGEELRHMRSNERENTNWRDKLAATAKSGEDGDISPPLQETNSEIPGTTHQNK